jgi:hypothetical protein
MPLGLKDAEEVGGNQWQQLAQKETSITRANTATLCI